MAKGINCHHRYQFRSVAQSCLTLWDTMDCSTPDFPVHHQLPKLAQTHVHRVSDASQLSNPLSSPSPPAFNFSHHQVFSSSSHQEASSSFSFSISPSNEYSGLISFRVDWLYLLVVQGTLKSLLQFFFNTTIQKHQFFSARLSLYSNSHIHTWLLEKP